MKRSLIVSTVFIILLSLVSCTSAKRPLLDYQTGLSYVNASFETEGHKYKINLTYEESGEKIEITEPEKISGISFLKENGVISAVSGDMKIPLSPELATSITPVFCAFSLSEEKITSISKNELGNTVYTISEESGDYTVTTDENGTPISIGFEGARTFSLSDILLQKIS